MSSDERHRRSRRFKTLARRVESGTLGSEISAASSRRCEPHALLRVLRGEVNRARARRLGETTMGLELRLQRMPAVLSCSRS
jgi:hypothetical protein